MAVLLCTIQDGRLLEPLDNPINVVEGDSVNVRFRGNNNLPLQSMTVNGVEAIPTPVYVTQTPTLTPSTNYTQAAGIFASYYSINNIIDGSNSTGFRSNDYQAIGKYVAINFSLPVTLKTISIYSSNTNQMPSQNQEVQISSNGTDWETLGTCSSAATDTFSDINREGITHIRLYCTAAKTQYLQVGEISLTYEVPTDEIDYYEYTIPNIVQDTNVIVIFGETSVSEDAIKGYFKNNGKWVAFRKVYHKVNDAWVELSSTEYREIISQSRISKNTN